MSLPWLRLYTEYATDPKIQILAFDDQRHFVMLLCLKGNGTLDCEAPSEAYRERLIAKALGLDAGTASEAKRRLMEGGLITADWMPVAWENRQMASDHDAAERQRRSRENRSRDSHNDVTTASCDSHAIDKKRLDKTRLDTDQSKTERVSRAKRSTATRLPEDWIFTPERQEVSRGEGVDGVREFAKFTDHWRSASGANARKLDWDASWRNWCRKAADYTLVGRKVSRPLKTADELDAEYEAAHAKQ